MYQSRFRYTNGVVSIAIDSLTGRILELVNEKTGENYIKNSCTEDAQPFELVTNVNGEKQKAYGGDTYDIAEFAELRPKITEEKVFDGSKIKVSFDCLTNGKTVIPVYVEYTIVIHNGSDEISFYITVRPENKSILVEKVVFPIINGVYIGESWQDDILVYPDNAGLKIENPVETFAAPRKSIAWKWQEYRYTYKTYNPSEKDGRLNFLERKFSGSLSMPFLCYYDNDNAFYFASKDKSKNVIAMRASTYGGEFAGMNFSFTSYPYDNDEWTSNEFVVALYCGDWHDGARRYREFSNTFNEHKNGQPEWFKKSAGLAAHYDFKYQCGGIVHKYKDIPAIFDKAVKLGVNHLLLSGWHKDGFDRGFPQYVFDEELGTEEELKQGVAYVKKNGGHVSFYMNSRLVNAAYKEYSDLINTAACKDTNQNVKIENYGNKTLNFAVMCNNTLTWRQMIENCVRYATDEIGIDGIYLDQIALASPGECHAKEHGHKVSDWNKGTRKLLEEVSGNYYKKHGEKLQMIHEGVSALYGDVSCGLMCSFQLMPLGAFPELYAYTFPEHRLVEAIYPKLNMAMRPVHVGQMAKKLINKTFLIGGYFWIYDLEEDCDFDLDKESKTYLQNALALTKYRLENFGNAVFCDTDGVKFTSNGNSSIKRFYSEEYDIYLCAMNDDLGKISLLLENAKNVSVYTANNGEVFCKNYGLLSSVLLPNESLCIIKVEK